MLCYIQLLLLAFSLPCSAQTYRGKILDESGCAMAFVNVLACAEGQRPVAYTQTDDKGVFVLEIPAGSGANQLLFKRVGFKTATVSLSHYEQGQVVTMHEEPFLLNEVEVKPEKIKQSGDTLVYNVRAFRQKQDRSIADVISKMPGLDVKPNGEITYQGKRINKFYIEGMDLLGNSYALASENMNADMVKDVQVYQNHQPLKVLKNINFSDHAALNIVLKDEAKGVWKGLAEIGAGSSVERRALFDTKLMEMLFTKRMQSVSMYKANNTGKDIQHEIRDLGIASGRLSPDKSLIDDATVSIPSLASNRYSFNNSHVLATNWLFKTQKDSELRLQLHGVMDQSNIKEHSEITLLNIGNDGSVITEEQDTRNYKNEWAIENTYTLNNENCFISNTLKGFVDFNSQKGINVYNSRSIQQKAKPRKRYLSNQTEWIKTISGDKSFSLHSNVLFNYLPGYLLLNDGTEERLGQHKQEFLLSTSFRHKVAGTYVTYLFGASTKRQTLSTENKDICRKDRFTQSELFLMPNLSYKTPVFKMNIGSRLVMMYKGFNSERKYCVLMNPIAFVDYKLTGKWNSTFSYNCMTSPTPFSKQIPTPVYVNYYTKFHGRNDMKNITTHTIANNWKFSDVLRGFFMNVGGTYVCMTNLSLYEGSLHNGFYEQKATQFIGNDKSCILNVNIGKSVGWGKLHYGVKTLSQWNSYQLIVSGNVAEVKHFSQHVEMNMSYHPAEILSLEGRSSWYYDRKKTSDKSIKLYSHSYFEHQLSLFVMPRNWLIEWKNNLYHSNDNTISNSFFSDLSVSYLSKTWEASVEWNNIFGQSHFSKIYTSPYKQSFILTGLRPSEIVFKFSFSI